MRFVFFVHSLVSDWNHGNAHFLRGIVNELVARRHEPIVYEPLDGWSRANLLRDAGPIAIAAFERAYPLLRSRAYDPCTLDLEAALDGADVVVVHEWNDPGLVARIGRIRAAGGRFTLLFHDTHHRSASAPDELAAYDLDAYDGVLAFGEVVRERYVELGWSSRAFTWHEAADTRVFHPRIDVEPTDDLVWIGNWGDDERTTELHEFLLRPVAELRLRANVHGVRYPDGAIAALRAHGLSYRGWIANHAAPDVFARHRVTVHVPRRPYVAALPGIPTIRVFEALACGIPLVCAPWSDVECLFRPGRDFLWATSGVQMRDRLREVLAEPELARELRDSGLETIRARHTCSHRVEELLGIVTRLRSAATPTFAHSLAELFA
jgi:spore maturation protein CgeB